MTWCRDSNLELFTSKTVEMDLRKNLALSANIILCDSPVNTVESFRFLGANITQDLKLELKICSLAKTAQQRMHS